MKIYKYIYGKGIDNHHIDISNYDNYNKLKIVNNLIEDGKITHNIEKDLAEKIFNLTISLDINNDVYKYFLDKYYDVNTMVLFTHNINKIKLQLLYKKAKNFNFFKYLCENIESYEDLKKIIIANYIEDYYNNHNEIKDFDPKKLIFNHIK
jgi:hypothetical protein